MDTPVLEPQSQSPLTITLSALTRLPRDASFKDIAEEVRITEVFEAVYEEVMSGKLISQEQVKASLREQRVPETRTYHKRIDELCLLAELEESSRQGEAGNYITHEEFLKLERPWRTK